MSPKSYLYIAQKNENDVQINQNGVTWVSNELCVKSNAVCPNYSRKISKKHTTESHCHTYDSIIGNKQSVIQLKFIGCNLSARIIENGKSNFYYSYGARNHLVYGYQEIKFVDFYPNIDLVYSLNESEDFFKFSFVLKENARIEDIQYVYLQNNEIINIQINNHGFNVQTIDLQLEEYGLKANHTLDTSVKIPIDYRLTNGIIGYKIDSQWEHKLVTIDPYIKKIKGLEGLNNTAPNNLSNLPIKVEYDDFGNLYIWGGGVYPNQPKLAKYSSSGNLLWVFMGEIASANWLATDSWSAFHSSVMYWIGTFTVNSANGYSYICQGLNYTGNEIIGLNDSGIWTGFKNKQSGKFLYGNDLDLSCDKKKLYVFGGINNWMQGGPANYSLNTTVKNPDVRVYYVLMNNSFSAPATAIVLDTQDLAIFYCGCINYCLSQWNHIVRWKHDTDIVFAKSTGFRLIAGYMHYLFPQTKNKFAYLGYRGLTNSGNLLANNEHYVYYYDGRYIQVIHKDSGTLVSFDSVKTQEQILQAGIAADPINHLFLGGDSAKIFCYLLKDSTLFLDSIIQLVSKSAQRIHDIKYISATQELMIIGDSLMAKIVSPYYKLDSNFNISINTQKTCGEPLILKVVNSGNRNLAARWLDSTDNKLVRDVELLGKDYDTLTNPLPGHVYSILIGYAHLCGKWRNKLSIKSLAISDTLVKLNLCKGDTFKLLNSKIFVDSLVKLNYSTRFNCDSTVYCQLHFKLMSDFSQQFSICKTDNIQIGNSYYTKAGKYIDTFTNFLGCDSLVYTTIVVKPDTLIVNYPTICRTSNVIVGANKYSNSGVYIDTLVRFNGCDSVIETHLKVLNDTVVLNNQKICQGDSIMIAGKSYKVAGTYIDSLQRITGCDSIIVTELQVFNDTSTSLSAEICNGDSIWIHNFWFKKSGVYKINLTRFSGCDSIVNFNLIMNSPASFFRKLLLCSADSFRYKGRNYVLPLTIVDTFKSYQNCDSFSILDIIGHHVNATFTIDSGFFPIYQFQSKTKNIKNWKWNFGDNQFSSIENPSHMYSKSTNWKQVKICLIVIDSQGCEDTVCYNLLVSPGELFKIPEGISPNGDGVNDFLEIEGLWAYPNATWSIFNSWGQIIWKSNSKENEKWNGKINVNQPVFNPTYQLPEGVYYIIFDFNDGIRPKYYGNIYLKP